MPLPTLSREYSKTAGVSMLELLITLALIGIIIAILTPKFLEMRTEALRQTSRQQTKVLEKALADWFAAQPSLADADTAWRTFDGNNDGLADPVNVMNALTPYLDQTAPIRGLPGYQAYAGGYDATHFHITTPEMIQLTTDAAASPTFIGGSGDMATDASTFAHAEFWWDPTVGGVRPAGTGPKVILFLPNIP